MAEHANDALARTALLLRLDAFPDASPTDDPLIVTALQSSTVQVVADERNLASVAGQTALVTLVSQVVMLGVRVRLDAPDVATLAPQPPLAPDMPLVTALAAWAEALLPGAFLSAGDPVVTFSLGDTRAADGAVRVACDATTALLLPAAEPASCWSGTLPFVPVTAAAAAAADAVRAVIPTIAELLGRPLPTATGWLRRQDPTLRLTVPKPATVRGDLGRVDIISGGAITHATLYMLLRLPDVRADIRIIEDDILAVSNSNRYALLRADDVGRGKGDQLRDFSTDHIRLSRVDVRYDADSVNRVGPLASRVLLGVDHVPTRWYTQRRTTGWLGVGATTHDMVLVSGHPPGEPCAGCVHPTHEPMAGDIPTISFVSMWAGVLLTTALLDTLDDPTVTAVHANPLGLHHLRGIRSYTPPRHPRCPVCGAARAA